MNTTAMFSSRSVHWSTPDDVYNDLFDEFKFDFDPCPLQSEDTTWLIKDWTGRVFCNPPYNNIGNFLQKAQLELIKGNIEIAVFLLPSRTGTSWWHNFCLRNCEIRFIRGRLKFGGAKINAPFDSVIVIFRSDSEREGEKK